MAQNDRITSRQSKAIAAILTSATLEQAAEKSGIPARTVRRWRQKDAAFRLALAKAEAEVIAQAAASIAAGSQEAVAILRVVQADKTEKTRDRISAANSILSHTPRIRMLGNLEQRIEELTNVNNERSNKDT